MRKYLYLWPPSEIVCFSIWIYSFNSIAFYQPSTDGPDHTFIRKSSLFIQQIGHKQKPQIHPNPFNDQLIIEGLQDNKFLIEIFDISGRKVFQRNIMQAESHVINTSDIKQGIYLVRVKETSENNVLLNQLVIKK